MAPPDIGGKVAHFYGIGIDAEQNVWLGGWGSGHVYRYSPPRDSFDTLALGDWTTVGTPQQRTSRGIAADYRGYVWVALSDGGIWRLSADIAPNTSLDLFDDTHVWPAGSERLGDSLVGVGIDLTGHVWGISRSASLAYRLQLDEAGEPLNGAPPLTDPSQQVKVGRHPYTYSDFTGFGFRTFGHRHGRYVLQLEPCDGANATWEGVQWNATLVGNGRVDVQVRTGTSVDIEQAAWTPVPSSPASFGPEANGIGLTPNPAPRIQIEITLSRGQPYTSPIVHDLDVTFSCPNDLH